MSTPANNLISQVLFTAAGTYDAQADQKTREGHGIRQVFWKTKPPLPAQQVRVFYDTDQRTQAWKMEVESPTFGWRDLAGANGATQLQAKNGPVARLKTGELKDLLIWQTANKLVLETRGYVTQHDTDWVGALTQVAP